MSEQFVPEQLTSEQLMKDYYTAYNSENSQALRAFYHDDVLMVSAQGESVGADAIIDTYQHLIDLFHDQMTPVNIDICHTEDGNESGKNGDGDFIAQVDIVDCFTAKKPVDDFMGQTLAEGESFELRLRGTYEVVNARFKKITIVMQ